MSFISVPNQFINNYYDVAAVSNETTISPAVGFVAAGLSVFFFGSNLVPVKKFETGDGVFFQWVLCIGLWLVGMAVHAFRNFPKFYPLAMVGGAMWCTGNVGIVSIIHTIGLGQGILIWASVNLITGWASSRLGLFGINKEIPDNQVYNYLGMSFCLVSAVCYLFISTESQAHVLDPNNVSVEVDPLLNEELSINGDETNNGGVLTSEPQQSFLDRLNPRAKRLYGTLMAIFGGILFGLNFTPIIYIQDRYEGNVSQNGLDYVFAHFSGILLASTFYMIVYCIIMKNKPRVYPSAILPGLLSGVLWAIGQTGWFIANTALSEPISFPIISTIPGIIGALWGVYFKEIKGKRNFIIMAVSFSIAITGAVLTALSK